MATVFDVFTEVEMEYLEISRGGVYGNLIKSSYPIMGIFKIRNGETKISSMENRTSTATAHIHPVDFEDYSHLVGNGIRYDDVNYEIVGMTVGTNFATGSIEHLTLTLEVADYVDDSESE